MSAVLSEAMSDVDYIERLLGFQAKSITDLSDELAKCIGALRGVANGLAEKSPKTSATLREIADGAYIVLGKSAGGVRAA